ncbi:hypothetical protein ACJX0J_011272 [Zea mays]
MQRIFSRLQKLRKRSKNNYIDRSLLTSKLIDAILTLIHPWTEHASSLVSIPITTNSVIALICVFMVHQAPHLIIDYLLLLLNFLFIGDITQPILEDGIKHISFGQI